MSPGHKGRWSEVLSEDRGDFLTDAEDLVI